MRRIITFIFLLTACISLQAEGRLFHITRIKNANIIAYDVNLKDGKLDMDKPIHPYWVRYAEEPVTTAELTYIQRKLAYGYKIVSKGNNEVTVKLTAYNERSIRVCYHKGKWVGIVKINGKDCVLNRIHVQTKPNNSLSVIYIELFGTLLNSSTSLSEKIYNN